MAYITESDVSNFIPERGAFENESAPGEDDGTNPTADQVTIYTTDVSAIVDAELLGIGISVPVSSNDYIKLICKNGAACLVEGGILSRMKDTKIPNHYCDTFYTLLDRLIKNPTMIGEAKTRGGQSRGGGFGVPNLGFNDEVV